MSALDTVKSIAFALLGDALLAFGIKKWHDEPKVLSPEAMKLAQERVRRHLFGIGPLDEADLQKAFNGVSTEDRVTIDDFFKKKFENEPWQADWFRQVITSIVPEEERSKALTNFALLPDHDARLVAGYQEGLLKRNAPLYLKLLPAMWRLAQQGYYAAEPHMRTAGAHMHHAGEHLDGVAENWSDQIAEERRRRRIGMLGRTWENIFGRRED